jgi:hypothetical protein
MSAIEQSIETGIRTALRAEMDAAEKSKDLPVHCFWCAPEHYADGTAPDRKATIPGVWVTARPYIPIGGNLTSVVHLAGRCSVEVRARVNPADDVDGTVLAALTIETDHSVRPDLSAALLDDRIRRSTDGGNRSG